jgi:IgA Peptidase M64/Peptidase M64 N-terminus
MRAIFSLCLFLTPVIAADPPRTMRLDFYHTGNATQELFALDRVVVEPLPWPGRTDKAIDDLNLGNFLFEVTDVATKKVLYSRGFDSIYGEWVTTAEAKTASRTFHESLRFPTPTAPVRVTVRKRDAANKWIDAWKIVVDPADMFIDKSIPDSPGDLIEIENNGPSADKVDLLLIGDGYTAAERKKFEADARKLTDRLFATSPFKERRKSFNVWGLCPPARESGISRPSNGIHRANPLGSTYDAFGSERYVLTFDNKPFRRAASFAPYEFVEILVNSRTYGGGGIFGNYGTVAANSVWASYVFVHEFGHHFAGLADEYYTSPVAYLPAKNRAEPWQPNVTSLRDPAKLKWKDLASLDTPLPTTWQKAEYEQRSKEFQARRAQLRKDRRPEDEMDALFEEQKRIDDRLLGAEKYAGKIGAFEGANYEATGFYRPAANCIMFSRTEAFCPVCRRAIERVIDQYAREP